MLLNNSLYYVGGIKDNRLDGKGTRYWEGQRYEGQFKKGKMHGKGILFDREGIFKGEWKNGNKEGRGVYEYYSGNRC